MDYSKKTELRIMSHNIWCGAVYNRDLHMRDIYMRYLPDVLGLQEMTPNLYESRIIDLLSSEYELLTHKEAEGFTDNTPLLIRKGVFDVIDHGWHLYTGLNNHKTKSLACIGGRCCKELIQRHCRRIVSPSLLNHCRGLHGLEHVEVVR